MYRVKLLISLQVEWMNAYWKFSSNSNKSRDIIMKARKAELWLTMLYTGSMMFCVTSVISFVTVWQHWTWTLGSCIDMDCGCILYGINTFRTFLGGDVKLCHFSSYGLTPIIVIAMCLGGLHGYRCCIHKNLDKPKQINRTQTYNDDR